MIFKFESTLVHMALRVSFKDFNFLHLKNTVIMLPPQPSPSWLLSTGLSERQPLTVVRLKKRLVFCLSLISQLNLSRDL